MKNLGAGISEGGVKGFFIQHGEKLVLGLAVLLVLLLLFTGYRIDRIPSSQTPTSLEALVSQAKTHINEDTWPAFAEARTRELILDERVKGVAAIRPADFRFAPLKTIQPRDEVRIDPVLLAPHKPETNGMFAAVAIVAPKPTDENALDSVPLATEEEPSAATPAPRSTRTARGSSGESASSGYPTLPGFGESSGGYSSSGTSGALGTVAKYRQLSPKQLTEIDRGWRGQFIAKPLVKSVYVVAVNATVPWDKEFQEYERAFGSAMGYDPARDVPNYIYFEVVRKDVTDSPDAAEDAPDAEPAKGIEDDQLKKDAGWVLVATTNSERFRAAYFAGQVVEIIDPMYYDPMLTMPLPPILLQDYERLALHTDVPKQTLVPVLPTTTKPVETDPDRIKEILKGGPGAVGPPGSGPGGPGYPGTSGESSMGPGYPGSTPGYSPTPGYGAMGSSSGEGGYGGSGTGYGSGSTGPIEPPVPYKLVRFCDLDAKPGRSYRYRVRVWLADPNNPLKPGAAGTSATSSSGMGTSYLAASSSGSSYGTGTAKPLEDSMLHPTVLERLKLVRAKDKAFEKANPGKTQVTYWRESPWSLASEVISVPTSYAEYLAGTATPPVETSIDANQKFVRIEPRGNVVASVWDPEYAANVAAQREVFRGSVLNFAATADVVHPIDLSVRRLEDFNFATDAVVLDIRGGETLPGGDRDNKFAAPGEFLVIDAQGKLAVANELDDIGMYRKRMIVPDDISKQESMYGQSSESSGYGESMGTGTRRPPRGRSPRSSE